MTLFRKGECSRQPVQHEKMTFDPASVCVQRKNREWKYQEMSEVGGLVYRFSGVQSSSQEQSSGGSYNREDPTPVPTLTACSVKSSSYP